MSFKRKIQPSGLNKEGQLDNDLAAIGFNLSHTSKSIDPNIEDTLLAASIEATQKNDGRLLSLVIDWITIHSERINAHRMTKIVTDLDKNDHFNTRIFWCANAQRTKDYRFKKLASLYRGTRIDFADRNIPQGGYRSTPFLIKRNGEDDRFKETCIRVPKKVFSERPHQIFSAEMIAKNHLPFKYRVIIGPSYRADMWGTIQRTPSLTPSGLAAITYGSYATAHQVIRDFSVIKRKVA